MAAGHVESELRLRLYNAASSVVTLCARLAIPFPLDEYDVMVLEPTTPGSATGVHQHRSIPAFQMIDEAARTLIEAEDAVVELHSFADRFVREEGKPLPMSFGGQQHGSTLLTHYFNRIGGYGLDEIVITEVCHEFFTDVLDSEAIVASVIPVEGFESAQEFGLADEITFRQISDEDIDRFGRGTGFAWSITRTPWLHRAHWICQVEQVSRKDTMDVFNDRSGVLEKIVGALSLCSEGRATFTLLARYWKSPFLDTGIARGGSSTATSGIGGGDVKLDLAGIEAFRSIFQKVRLLGADGKYGHLQLPFRRLRMASSRSEKEDQLVDHVIGLENLLAKDSPNLETTYRFRLRGAALLPGSFGKPRERMILMNALYGLRSAIVHGRAKETEVNEFVPTAEKALRTLFLWYLDSVESKGDADKIIAALDESMVAGGSTWSQGDP